MDGKLSPLIKVGLILSFLVIFLALTTALYPLGAGLAKLGTPNIGKWASVQRWWVSIYGHGNYFSMWKHAAANLSADKADPLVWEAIQKAALFALMPILGIGGLVGHAIQEKRKSKPKLTRRLLRGPRLVEPEEMPETVAAIVATALHGADEKRRKKAETRLRQLKAPKDEVSQILKDAKNRQRHLTKESAVSEARLSGISREAHRNGFVRLGNVPVPPELETYHSLICASTGTGKSVALRQLLADLRRRGDRVIVVDAGYDMSPMFRQRDDLVLSLFDGDSVGWNLRNEIRRPSEWMTYAASLFPAGPGESGEWDKKAQVFFANVSMNVGRENTNKQLLEYLTVFPIESLGPILDGTPSGTQLHEGGERYLASVRNNIGEKLSGWQFTIDGDFSCRTYMAGDDPRWLWLPYRDADKGILAPAIATWLDILIMAGLERSTSSNNRKTWIVIDELDSIGTIGSLKDAVTRLRKSNVAVVCAIQDFNQLAERYGENTAGTLFGCFSNRLYLRCNSAELAERVSKELGEAEFEETRIQLAHSQNRSHDSKVSKGKNFSVSTQLVKGPVKLPSEIQRLPALTGFVTLAGFNEILCVTQDYRIDLEGV